MSFGKDMERITNDIKKRNDLFVRSVLIRLGRSLVLKSPVGNPTLWKSPPPKGYVGGRFRANWQMAAGAMPDGVIDSIDPSGGATIGKLTSGAATVAIGGTIFLTNNLPYAKRIEYGHSTQSPAGVVGLTVAEFSSIVGAAVREVKK